MEKIGLYVHIPFCKQKCVYCAFCSFCATSDVIESYFEKLKEEIILKKDDMKNKVVSTIFFGGGTPSFVDGKYICDVLKTIKSTFKVQKNAEISIECNPDSITLKKAKMWKKCGINRVSVGLQSINNKTLKILGRPHNFDDFLKAISCLKKAGFKNINADILLGLFNQTKNEIKRTIQVLNEQNLTHISAYGLMVEDGTPLKQMVEEKKFLPADEEKAVMLYNFAVNELKKYGYNRYEISNFCKKGFECKHNLNYWHRGEFLGIGLSAYSFLNGTHFENTSDMKSYLNNPFKKKNKQKETKKMAMEEFVMLALRLEEGLDIKEFNKKFNEDFEKKFAKQIKKLQESNLVKIENGHLIILNFEVSNMIICEFF